MRPTPGSSPASATGCAPCKSGRRADRARSGDRPIARGERAGRRIAAIRTGLADNPAWLAPELVDLQVNGFMGYDVNAEDVTADDIGRLARALHTTGVTSFAPTVISTSEEGSSPRSVRSRPHEVDPLVRHAIPFAHVEGPHLSPEDGPRGAHPRQHIRPPVLAEFERWQRASGGRRDGGSLATLGRGPALHRSADRARDPRRDRAYGCRAGRDHGRR